jgi:acylphosphatase
MAGEIGGLHAFIEGRVQGVGFRAFVHDCAAALGLTGWVRNKGDDMVEVWAEGPTEDLEKLFGQLRKGPSMAYVSDVQISHPAPEGKFKRFMVISSIW